MRGDAGPALYSGIRAEKIPFEIWLQIIEYSSLDRADLLNLTLVSKFLCFVAQPMLFATIRVTIIRARYLDTLVPIPCQDVVYHDRLKKRLEFASLLRVVQFVKAFDIRMGGERVDLLPQDTVSEPDVLETVFRDITRFSNLRSLFVQNVSLTGKHFDSLAGLKYFSGIHLERCQCTGDLGLARFRLKSLSLHGKMTGTHGWWIPLLKSPTLEHLSYDATSVPADDPELLFPALATGPMMSSLRTLRVPAFAAFYPCFALALSRCPLVENLYVDSPELALRPTGLTHLQYPYLGPRSLPKLRAVSAPRGFVEGCIPQHSEHAQLKHIRVSEHLYRASEFVTLVKNTCPDLEELVLTLPALHDSDTAWLRTIFTSLESLRGLHITYIQARFSHKQLRDFLKTTAYPATLRSLHILALFPSQPAFNNAPLTPKSSAPRRSSSGKQSASLVQRIRARAPDIAEIEITLQKPVSWRDMYARRTRWYEWDLRGSRSELI